jgi:A/G-specific adenine glycosylase
MTQALMELGATVCAPAPRCEACPLAAACAAKAADRTGEIPPVAKRTKPKEQDLLLLAVEAEGHFLLHAPSEKGLLAGLWRWPALPGSRLRATGHQAVETPTFYSASDARAWEGWTQVYTHRRERIEPLRLCLPKRFAAAEDLRWVPAGDLPSLALGRRDGRLRDLLKTEGQPPLQLPPDLLNALREPVARSR